MLFDDLDENTRKSTIKWIEESIFGAHLFGSHYFRDVAPTSVGFNEARAGGLTNFQVNVPPSFFK
jgi:hypothetical protein